MFRSWGVGDWYSLEWVRSFLTSPSSTALHPDSEIQPSASKPTFEWQDVQVESVEKEIVMESSERFVDTFSMMLPMITKNFWSEKERREVGDMAVSRLLEWMEEKYGKGKEVKMTWAANLIVLKKGANGDGEGK
ncbi:MAG: hypothetical protein Q9180_005783 [Flavoplaca navasiana]